MPALTVGLKNFNLSLTYDGLTFYYNFQRETDLFARLSLCQQTLNLNNTFDFCSSHFSHRNEFDRFIHRDDDDHGMYHQDQYAIDKDHSHFKFKTPITRDKLVGVLDEFIKHNLISKDEKDNVLTKYDDRNAKALLNLRASLSGTKDIDIDTREIINFIRSCTENDILGYLHESLLMSRFDYLRAVTAYSPAYIWQGTNGTQQVVETSKQWAMIQKAMSLQLANNIRQTCDTFSKDVANERASQLRNSFVFFGLKRKAAACTYVASSMFKAYSNQDENTFEKKYNNHFQKYR